MSQPGLHHTDGDGQHGDRWHNDSDGRNDDASIQRRHGDGDGDRRHDDGKGQRGKTWYDNGDRHHGDAA